MTTFRLRSSLAAGVLAVATAMAATVVTPPASAGPTPPGGPGGPTRCDQGRPTGGGPGGPDGPTGPGGPSAPPGPGRTDHQGIVVRVDSAGGYTIADVLSAFPVTLSSTVLASRKVYLVTANGTVHGPQLQALADRISNSPAVIYAELDGDIEIADTRFSSWTDGSSGDADASQFWTQAAATSLALTSAHATTDGTGRVVAVLDTGMDATHPALAGPTVPGWDYVDDDADTADRARGVDSDHDGIVDSAVGHGTFVSGLVRLVAPGATILHERVLDSDGNGTVFGVAQAIQDAVAAGANVVNLSFGTVADVDSRLLDSTIRTAQARGVVVVAAAGNTGTEATGYPAALPGVLSVAALAGSGFTCLATFSGRGRWVHVAAPGDQLVGPVPDGRFVVWSGTSLATPLAAGQAALLAAAAPRATRQRIVDAIEGTARGNRDLKVRYGAIDILASLSRLRGPGGPRG